MGVLNSPWTGLLLLLHLSLADGVQAQRGGSAPVARGTVTLKAPGAACRVAMLNDRPAPRSADSLFRFSAVEPGGYQLLCGAPIEIYVQPGAALRITLSPNSAPLFQGRGAAMNRYLSAPRAMSTPLLTELWTERPQDFENVWSAAYTEDISALRRVPGADAAFRERENMRLRFRHAFGRVVYPYFHWRQSDDAVLAPDGKMSSLLTTLLEGGALNDPRWYSLPEHAELLQALIHENARTALVGDSTLQRGDARWLRAEFAIAAEIITDSTLRRRTMTRLLASSIEENGSRGVDSVYGRWIAEGVDSLARKGIDSLIAIDRGMQGGHEVETYRTVDDVAMNVHILRPEGADSTTVSPAMLWFHGGSWSSGIWWHSPGVLGALREQGVTVVGVELRTTNRFNSGPLEQVEDAVLAYDWIVRNAARLRLDSTRVGVAGFSSGGTLATILGTRGLLPPPPIGAEPEAPPSTATRRFPAAVIAVGACVFPGGPGDDGYFRKTVGQRAMVADFTPLLSIRAGQPPMLLVHAANDEYCDVRPVRSVTEQARQLGNQVTLSEVANAGHFFGFYHQPGLRQLRQAIQNALREWGWNASP